QICKAEDDSSREKALIPGEWASPLALREHDVPEFPVESLPGWLSAMVAEVARVTQTPTDLGATFALAVLSTVWSRRVVAEVHPFWREPVNLYLLVAAESGARKSAVYRHFVSPVSEFERALQEELRHELKMKRFARQALEGRLQRAQASAAKAETPEGRDGFAAEAAELLEQLDEVGPGADPRLLADSVTPEKLVSLLAEQGGRMSILEPEGTLFGMLTGRYSRRPDLSAFLKGHPGE